MKQPTIIQGGMGVAVSDWRLARSVALEGQMGVVSGTGIDVVLARRLQMGDVGGHMRRAMDAFPDREMADRIWERYYIPGGKAPDAPFKSRPLSAIEPTQPLAELMVVSNFVEVWLAKEGHDNPVGINFLTKIQLPTLWSILGAMVAEVDYVLMGAGIPRAIPAILDRFAAWEPAELTIDVYGATNDDHFVTRLDPAVMLPNHPPRLKRPDFLAIITSATLATSLHKKSTGKVNGFIVEGQTAGGHNAPPRGPLQLDENGEPVYGPRDVPDLVAIRDIGLPFWLAGSYGDPEKVVEALETGATGVQIGTAFAFCNESGLDASLKRRVLEASRAAQVRTFTDPLASPTGFPFKVVQLPQTLSDAPVYERRNKICDLGYLRTAYKTEKGTVGYRCPAEPDEDFLKKGGDPADIAGRKCVCNGLLSTIGLGQVRKDGYHEPPILTAGDEVATVARFLPEGADSYSAADVVRRLLSGVRVQAAA